MSKSIQSIKTRFYAFEFLTGFHFFSAVLTPMFTQWTGWGNEGYAIGQTLQSWFTLCIFLLEVPTGVVADKVGRKHSLALGSLVISFATILYASAPELWRFILAEGMFALGVALISGADKALLHDCLKEHGQEADSVVIWGRSRSIHLSGILIAAPVGSLIAERLGLNWPMLLTSIPAFLAAVAVFSIPEPKIETPGIDKSKSYFRFAWGGMRYLLHHPILLRWSIFSTLVGTAGYFVIWLYQPLMIGLHLPISTFGIAHVGLVVSELIISALYKPLAALAGSPKKLFTLSALLVAAVLILTAIAPSPLTLILLLTVAGGLGLTQVELMSAEMNKHIESFHRATVHSGVSMGRRIVLAVLNPIVGMTTTIALPISFLLVGLIPLLTIFFPLNGGSEEH